MENYFLDGTKIEADTNKYSFVWKKSTEKFEANLRGEIQETLQHIHELTQIETGTESKKCEQNTEIFEDDLKKVAYELEQKVEALTEEIEKEPDTNIRKEKRKERSQFIHETDS